MKILDSREDSIAQPIAGVICLGISLILILIFATLRLLSSENMGLNWDTPIIIDGSYRVFLGQKPHHDFSTPIGALYFLIGAFGMWLSTPTMAGLSLGIVLFGFALLSLSLWFLKDMQRYLLAIFILILGSYLFTTKMLHATNPASGGYTGLYNLYGYSILFIMSTYLYVWDATKNEKEYKNLNTLFLAIMLFLAFFIKNSFGVVLIFLILIFLFNLKYIKIYRSLIFYFSVLLLILICWLDFDVRAILRDQIIVMTARFSSGALGGIENIKYFVRETWIDNVYILIALLYSKYLLSPFEWRRLVKLGIFFLVSAYILSSSIMQKPVHILSGYFAFIVIYQLSITNKDWLNFAKKIPLVLISLLFVLNIFYLNMWGVAQNFSQVIRSKPLFNIQESRLSYQPWVDSNLISEHNKSQRIMSVGVNNFFNFFFLEVPPIDIPLYWHNTVTFNEFLLRTNPYFEAKKIFKEVDIVYINFSQHGDTSSLFYEYYKNFLDERFSLAYNDLRLSIYIKK